MFAFLHRKPSYPATSVWSISQGTNNGRPLMLRRNKSAKSLIGHPDYCHRVGFAVPIKYPDANGFPRGDDFAPLETIENQLAARLEANQDAILVLIISTDGMREFVFYSRNPKVVPSVLDDLRRMVPTYDVQTYTEEDPKWRLFRYYS